MILVGDSFEKLTTLATESVQSCITSPPYWGLRDYGTKGQLGLERTPDEYILNLRMIFEQVRRILKPSGTLWLNLGDSYATGGGRVGKCPGGGKQGESWKQRRKMTAPNRMKLPGLKTKDLVGIPWRMAFALQADGWYLRQDIIWHKPNPMPESVRDRCTKAHEYIFLLSKSAKYYFNVDAIKEPAKYSGPNSPNSIKSPYGQGYTRNSWKGSSFNTGKTGKHQLGRSSDNRLTGPCLELLNLRAPVENTRQKRSVWQVSTTPFKGAHFATFPQKLIEPCILAGSAPGDTILDPFFGAGTTGLVAQKHGREYIGIELNPKYARMAKHRIENSI